MTNTTATILALINTTVAHTALQTDQDYLKQHGFLEFVINVQLTVHEQHINKTSYMQHCSNCGSILGGDWMKRCNLFPN
jgi:hypothetical protein